MGECSADILTLASPRTTLETALAPLEKLGTTPIVPLTGRFRRVAYRAGQREVRPELLSSWLRRKRPVILDCRDETGDEIVWASFDCRFPPLLQHHWDLYCGHHLVETAGLVGMDFFFQLAGAGAAIGFVFNPFNSTGDVDWADICLGAIDTEAANRHFASRRHLFENPARAKPSVVIFPTAARTRVALKDSTLALEWRHFTILVEPMYLWGRHEPFIEAAMAHGAVRVPGW